MCQEVHLATIECGTGHFRHQMQKCRDFLSAREYSSLGASYSRPLPGSHLRPFSFLSCHMHGLSRGTWHNRAPFSAHMQQAWPQAGASRPKHTPPRMMESASRSSSLGSRLRVLVQRTRSTGLGSALTMTGRPYRIVVVPDSSPPGLLNPPSLVHSADVDMNHILHHLIKVGDTFCFFKK